MAKSVQLIALAVMTLGLIVGLWVLARGLETANRAQGDGKRKGEVMLRQALTTWDAATFYGQADPEFRRRNPEASVTLFFRNARRDWGELRSLGPTALRGIPKATDETTPPGITAAYTTPATFEKGTTTVRWAITRRNNVWRWAQLTLDPPSTAPAPAR